MFPCSILYKPNQLNIRHSDTTRASLIALWYFMCKHPQHAEKTLAELGNIDETDSNILAKLPHLNGVVNETLRLLPPQMTGGGRMTSAEGLWVDDTWIPGGVKVTASKYVLSRCRFAALYLPEVRVRMCLRIFFPVCFSARGIRTTQ